MTDPQTVLSLLEEALATSRRMLTLAQAGDWDALVECELIRRSQIAALRAREQSEALVPDDGPDRAAIVEHMRAILEADQATGELVKTWMSQISANLGEIDMARKVSAAYGVR